MDEQMKEITGIIDEHCSGCPVASLIRKEHGSRKKHEYCTKICAIGKKVQKLSRNMENGTKQAYKAMELDLETYQSLKDQGWQDKKIREAYNLSHSTLYRRKKAWGIAGRFFAMNRIADKEKQDYLDLKVQNFTDDEVAEAWGVALDTLRRWKDHRGLYGGLERMQEFKIDAIGKTVDDYKDLKRKKKTDMQVAAMWDVSINALVNWKRANGLKGVRHHDITRAG